MKHIYFDESIFSEPNPYVGYGALITDEKIEYQIINEALKNLYNDKDRFESENKEKDQRTLDRGYFHATDDSKNAHSHICTQINKKVNGDFSSNFMEPKLKNDEKIIFKTTSMLSSLRLFNFRHPIKFIFEERQGLNEKVIKKWYKETEMDILKNIYNYPFIPACFPKIEVEIADKNNPGLQIVDFILWSVNRKINGIDKWYNRLHSKLRMNMNPQKNKMNWGGEDLIINNGVERPKHYYQIEDFPNEDDITVTENMMVNIYLHAEKVIKFYSINKLPEHLTHQNEDIKNIASGLMDKDSKDRISKVACQYLKLFDTVPLITKQTSKKEKQFLLLSKKYLSLVLRTDLINGVRTNDYLERIRYEILQKNPEEFKFFE